VAGVGGRRPGGGRPLGSRNKATADIRALAQPYGPAAVLMFAEMAGLLPGKPPAESEQARIAAGKELLDRGYGRSMQPVLGEQTVHIVGGIDSPPRPATIEDAEQWLIRRRKELAELDSPSAEPPQASPRYEAPVRPSQHEPPHTPRWPSPRYPETPQSAPPPPRPQTPATWTAQQEADWQRQQERQESEPIGFRMPRLPR
jgi:hypothetical protein